MTSTGRTQRMYERARRITTGQGGAGLWTLLASAIASLAAGAAVVVLPQFVLLLAAAVACISLVVSGRARVLAVVFGGLVALQSSAELDAVKLAYLAAVSIAVLVAAVRLFVLTEPDRITSIIGIGSLPFGAVVLGSFFVAQYAATPFSYWLRDVAPYLLFAVAPILALDAGKTTSAAFLRLSLVGAGLAAGLSYSVEWFGRREIVVLPITHLGLPSGQLVMAAFALAFATTFLSRSQRVIWAVAGIVALTTILATGTRSALVVVIVPIAIALAYSRRSVSRSVVMLAGLIAAIVVVLAAVSILASVAGGEVHRLDDRFASIARLISDPESDASYVERVRQLQADWEIFVDHLGLGAGPGRVVQWITFTGEIRAGYDIDSPIGIASKFGLLGVFAVLVSFSGWIALLRGYGRAAGVPTLTTIGFLAEGLAGSVLLLGIPIEDKGFGLASVLLLGLVIAVAGTTRPVRWRPTRRSTLS